MPLRRGRRLRCRLDRRSRTPRPPPCTVPSRPRRAGARRASRRLVARLSARRVDAALGPDANARGRARRCGRRTPVGGSPDSYRFDGERDNTSRGRGPRGRRAGAPPPWPDSAGVDASAAARARRARGPRARLRYRAPLARCGSCAARTAGPTLALYLSIAAARPRRRRASARTSSSTRASARPTAPANGTSAPAAGFESAGAVVSYLFARFRASEAAARLMAALKPLLAKPASHRSLPPMSSAAPLRSAAWLVVAPDLQAGRWQMPRREPQPQPRRRAPRSRACTSRSATRSQASLGGAPRCHAHTAAIHAARDAATEHADARHHLQDPARLAQALTSCSQIGARHAASTNPRNARPMSAASFA